MDKLYLTDFLAKKFILANEALLRINGKSLLSTSEIILSASKNQGRLI